MSFSFVGAGAKADVIHQIRSHHGYDDQQLAVAVRELIVQALRAHEDTDNFVYKVSANGHTGPGAAVSLNVAIEPYWVPSLRAPEPSPIHDSIRHEFAASDYLPTAEATDSEVHLSPLPPMEELGQLG